MNGIILIETYSFGVNDVNDSGKFTSIWSVIDQNNSSNFNKSGECLERENHHQNINTHVEKLTISNATG